MGDNTSVDSLGIEDTLLSSSVPFMTSTSPSPYPILLVILLSFHTFTISSQSLIRLTDGATWLHKHSPTSLASS